MYRGSCSEENINCLNKEHLKFLMAVRISLSFVKKVLDSIYEDIRIFTNFNKNLSVYSYTVPSEWNYSQECPYKGDTISDKRRIYIHLYYNIDKEAEYEKNFGALLTLLQEELLSGNRVESHEKQYKKFFEIREIPKHGIQITPKEDAIKEARRYYGYFALITNETMDAASALKLYRAKDVVEKVFGNLKERLNMRRMLVSSEQSLEGKLFVGFIALIYISYINKTMQDQGMYKNYTLQQVLDKLDIIECFEHSDHELRVSEILEKQKDIYLKLGVEPPTLL